MKKEDLRIGMKIIHYNKNIRTITGFGEEWYFYRPKLEGLGNISVELCDLYVLLESFEKYIEPPKPREIWCLKENCILHEGSIICTRKPPDPENWIHFREVIE